MEHALFPKEVTGHVPLITITGAQEVRVEQHRGLVSYQPQQVVLRTTEGLLTISGSELYFSRYSADEVVLTGRVDGIAIQGADGGGVR